MLVVVAVGVCCSWLGLLCVCAFVCVFVGCCMFVCYSFLFVLVV